MVQPSPAERGGTHTLLLALGRGHSGRTGETGFAIGMMINYLYGCTACPHLLLIRSRSGYCCSTNFKKKIFFFFLKV